MIPDAVLLTLGVLSGFGGLGVLLGARRGWRSSLRLPVVGRVTEPTVVLSGVALMWLGYHGVVYAMGWTALRAPVWAVFAVPAALVVGSALTDAATAPEEDQPPRRRSGR